MKLELSNNPSSDPHWGAAFIVTLKPENSRGRPIGKYLLLVEGTLATAVRKFAKNLESASTVKLCIQPRSACSRVGDPSAVLQRHIRLLRIEMKRLSLRFICVIDGQAELAITSWLALDQFCNAWPNIPWETFELDVHPTRKPKGLQRHPAVSPRRAVDEAPIATDHKGVSHG